MFERFTDRTRTAMAFANAEAKRRNAECIETAHILLGLIREGCGCAVQVMRDFEVDPERLAERVEQFLEDSGRSVSPAKLPQTKGAKQVIEYAIEEARSLHHGFVGTGHVLLGLLCAERGIASHALAEAGLTYQAVQERMAEISEADVRDESGATEEDGRGDVRQEEPDAFKSLSDRARKVMAIARREAQRYSHDHIGTEHILLALRTEGAGLGAMALIQLGIATNRLRDEFEKRVVPGTTAPTEGELPQTPRAAKMIEYALEEARALNCDCVDTEHLLLGMIRDEDATGSRILGGLVPKLEAIQEALAQHRRGLDARRERALERHRCGRGTRAFQRFTDRARKVLALANQEAQRFNHEWIGTEHILLGLVKEGSGAGATVLKKLDVDMKKLRLEVEKLVKSGPEMVTMGKLPQTPRAKNVIEYAIEEAQALNHNYVGTEHILLGLLRESEGIAAQVLANLDLKLGDLRREVLNVVGVGVKDDVCAIRGEDGMEERPTVDHQGTRIWKKADALAHAVYKVTGEFPKEESSGVASQLRRVALLLPPNIGEAYERSDTMEARWFVNISLGLVQELRYGLDFSAKLEYLKPEERRALAEVTDQIETELRRFHASLVRV